MLTSAGVVEAGTRVAVDDGLGSVGIRSVARELDVTPMALYRYVDDATTLHEAVVEALIADLPLVPSTGTWTARCRAWALAARPVFARAPGLAEHLLIHWTHLPKTLAAVDGLVAVLEDAGPPRCDPVAGANALFMHALMRAQAERVIRTDGVTRDLAWLRERRRELPRLWAHRHEYAEARLDEHFRYALDALLAGLARTQRVA